MINENSSDCKSFKHYQDVNCGQYLCKFCQFEDNSKKSLLTIRPSFKLILISSSTAYTTKHHKNHHQTKKKSERGFSICKLTKHPLRRSWREQLESVPDTASSWSPGGRSGLSSSGTTQPYPSSQRTGSGIQTWTAGSDWSSVGYTVIQDKMKKIHTEVMKKIHNEVMKKIPTIFTHTSFCYNH